MVNEAKFKSTITLMICLLRYCWCSTTSSHCNQLITNQNNTTGQPVLYGISASQAEIKTWHTTKRYWLRCCVTGKPQPKITWYKDGDILTFETNRREKDKHGQAVVFSDIRQADEGNYTCIAQNEHGKVSHSFLVKVTSIFLLQKPVVIIQHSPWKTFVGDNVTLSCKIMKSARAPWVTWLHHVKNKYSRRCMGTRYNLNLSKTKEDKTWLSKLTIFNVTMDDEGNYTCIARNGAGSGKSAQENGTLIVLEFEPTIYGLQEETSLIKKPLVVGLAAVMSIAIIIIILLSLAWVLKKSRSRLSHTHFPINDQQPFSKQDPTFDSNPLLFHTEDEMHIEIPKENLQLLRRGVPQAIRDSNIDFDVFVSYSSLDRDFVKNNLYAELTTTHSVCIDFKDFEAGLFITDNIANSVFRSRKTLLVVTRNFLNGVWTFFEMQLAQGRLSEGHDVLILVVVENIPTDELPKPLQHYRKMKTYLEYYNEDVKPHFWDRLRSAIGPSLQQSVRTSEADQSC